MDLRIQPEPDAATREAVARALARPAAQGATGGHPAYESRWRRAGIELGSRRAEEAYATARPRSSRGATRA